MDSIVGLLDIWRPLLLLCKILGLNGFTIDRRRHVVKHTITDTLYVSFVIIIHTIGTIVNAEFSWSVIVNSGVAGVMMLIELLGSYIKTMIAITKDLRSVRIYNRMLQDLYFCDHIIALHPGSGKRWRKVVVALELIPLLITWFDTVLRFINFVPDYINRIRLVLYAVQFLVAWTVVLRFANLLLLIKSHFALLNGQLSGLRDVIEEMGAVHPRVGLRINGGRNCVSLYGGAEVERRLHSLRRVHSVLCDLSDDVFGLHEAFVAVHLVQVVVHAVRLCFLLMRGHSSWAALSSAPYIANRASRLLVVLALLALPPHLVAAEARRSAALADRLLLCVRRCDVTRRTLLLFCQQARRRVPAFNVCGVIRMNLWLLYFVPSVFVNYTVLLLTLA